MGNKFDDRQVNEFIVNQGVMNTCKNKFLLFIKIRSVTIRQLQLNYNSLNFRLVLRTVVSHVLVFTHYTQLQIYLFGSVFSCLPTLWLWDKIRFFIKFRHQISKISFLNFYLTPKKVTVNSASQ